MPDTTKRSSVKATLAQKVLMPIVAAGASAAASYLAKKAPQYLEQTVLPKLREAKDGAGGAARDLPARAKATVGGAGEVAQDLAGRARSVVGGDSGDGGGNGRTLEGFSPEQLERRRNERAEHRAARRKASTT
jgi:hypothetical protein